MARPSQAVPFLRRNRVLHGAHALALELVAGLARSSKARGSRTPGWLEQVDELLQERFHESWSLTAIATYAGVHPVHLARTYRQHRGRTVGERLRELRIERACHLLASTGETVAEIAQCCGFADQSHLARSCGADSAFLRRNTALVARAAKPVPRR